MDDVDLPPLPASSTTALPLSSSSSSSPPSSSPRLPSLLCRKRTHSDYDDEPLTSTSSDPALFSSDEQTPGAEDYEADGRRRKGKKRHYKGSWWDHRVTAGRPEKKREFQRNFDSGIFMGSEGSEDVLLSSDSFGALEEELLQDQNKDAEAGHGRFFGGRLGAARSLVSVDLVKRASPIRSEHDPVLAIVHQCLDQGREDVDLSSMSLSTLPPEISQLHTLTKQTDIVPGMLDTGTSLETELRLYLANNLLVKVPRPILDLHNLRLLSLRQNNLTDIPPGIRDLVNLQTLNVAGNQLRYLPFEVLELARFHKLDQIISEPNPWTSIPDHVPIGLCHVQGRASAVLTRLAIRGDECGGAAGGAAALVDHAASHSPSVPSLTELVLRQLAKLEPRVDLVELMPPETSETVLDRLGLLKDQAGRRCTKCKRLLVLPQKQWLEWWALHGPEKDPGPTATTATTQSSSHLGVRRGLPFVRMQCSATCLGREDHWCEEIVDETSAVATTNVQSPSTFRAPARSEL